MLVANTAGYIDYVRVQDFLNLELAEPFRTFTDEELINYSTRDGKMNFAPGTSQQYSHTDNVMLGQVIQRATRQSMKELYNGNIFGPLGMKDTEYPIDQSIKAPVPIVNVASINGQKPSNIDMPPTVRASLG